MVGVTFVDAVYHLFKQSTPVLEKSEHATRLMIMTRTRAFMGFFTLAMMIMILDIEVQNVKG